MTRVATPVLAPEILANHVGILGKTGSGKSNLAKVVTEQLLASGERVVVLDPTGTWYGLRLTREGTPSPFRVVIFGGAHGDIPIAQHHGEEIAAALARSSTSAIIDTRRMTVKARTVFATAFAETLLQLNAGILYVVIDESHLFAPQGKVPDPDSGKMVNAFNNLASLGRGVGLILILISQRPAKLHKDSLTQIETLIGMRLIAPQDRAAFREWVKENADEGQGAEIMRSLAKLPTGTGWVWAPALDILEQRSFPLASTLDTGKPSANPDVALGPIDIDAIRAQLGRVEEERKANDPAELRQEIARLKRELEQRPAETKVETVEVERRVEVPVLTLEDHKLLRQLQARLDEVAGGIEVVTPDGKHFPAIATRATPARVELAPRAVPVPAPKPRPSAPPTPRAARPVPAGSGDGRFGKAERSILASLAAYDTLTRDQLAFAANYHPNTGGFNNALGSLRSGGLITPSFPAALTDAGAAAVRESGLEPQWTPPLDEWLDRLVSRKEKGLLHGLVPVFPADHERWRLDSWVVRQTKAERLIIEQLFAAHPNEVGRTELAAATGYHPNTGGFNNALGHLRSLGILDGFRVHPTFAQLVGW